MRCCILAIISLLSAHAGASGTIKSIEAKGGILMLAKTIAVEDAPVGTVHTSTGHSEKIRLKAIQLQPLDVFVGKCPKPLQVVIPASAVDNVDLVFQGDDSNYIMAPDGLQPGDVSI